MSSTIVFPRDKGPETTKPLSILDVCCYAYALCSGVWVYPAECSEINTFDKLQESLCVSLNHYPQFCGSISWIPIDLEGDIIARSHRLQIRYGYETDPGVVFSVKHFDRPSTDFQPNRCHYEQGSQVWNMPSNYADGLLPETELVLVPRDDPTLPAVAIQLSVFSDNATAIGIKISHCISDARTMTNFMQVWGAIHNAMSKGESGDSIPITAIFDPLMLDNTVAKVQEGVHDDEYTPSGIRVPGNNFDLWNSAPNVPPFLADKCIPHPLLDKLVTLRNQRDWTDWKWQRPCSSALIHFTRDQVMSLYNACHNSTDDSTNTNTDPISVSKNDAVVGHVWSLVIKHRSIATNGVDDQVCLNITVGVRPRLAPPLPNSYAGCPLLSCTGRLSLNELKNSQTNSMLPVGMAARTIRETLNELSPTNVAHAINDMRHERAPYRIWQGGLGDKQLVTTSWINTGIYDVTFDGVHPPVFVLSVMPEADGILQISEAPPSQVRDNDSSDSNTEWFKDGVDIVLSLEKDVLAGVLNDQALFNPLLFTYHNNDEHKSI